MNDDRVMALHKALASKDAEIKALRKALAMDAEALRVAGYTVVPTMPTKEMLEAAWADALNEDAAGVWSSMIDAGQIEFLLTPE